MKRVRVRNGESEPELETETGDRLSGLNGLSGQTDKRTNGQAFG